MNEELNKENKHSITLKKTAKGYNWDIKLYFDEINDTKVVDSLEYFDTKLRLKFD